MLVVLASLANAGTISGTVKGPDQAPVAGVFVQAQNAQTKMMVSVLSDRQGHYRVPNLPAGDYEVWARATGLKGDAPSRASVAADQTLAMDFAVAKAPVAWSELSLYQGGVLLPEGKGKKALFTKCFACHGFETRMAANAPHDETQWRALVDYMVQSMHFFLATVGQFNDQDETDVVQYLTDLFGPNSKLPDPTTLPKYADVKLGPFGDEAMKIVYVEYDMPGPNRMPWSAFPDKDGHYWIPYYGDANAIGRLDPKTGEVKEFKAPNIGTAAIHSAVPAQDGSVWFTEQGSNKIGRWDPGTQKITEFQDAYLPGKENTLGGGSKHTLRVAPNGDVWSTGGPLSRYNNETGKFTPVPEVPSAYGIALASDATVWFAEFTPQGEIGKIDPQTLHVTKWQVPTAKAFPRRIQIDSDGTVWFCEFVAGKLGHFDPKTERFTEYDLPGPEASPYALGIDRDHRIWFSSEHMDYVGRLDPATGKVTQYPVPQSENSMREFYLDDQGRMWFGSPSNNKVGYFYLAE
ncbi:MAG TPA: carboxypeptidase regulatory-like domain-containing protein [Stellaceae bacterium]|nr:carboxypeptidase regulatory-like domain-containing protein [Stellaceae bacterium]